MSMRMSSRSQPLLAASVNALLPFLSAAWMSAPRSSSNFTTAFVSAFVGRTFGAHPWLEKSITRMGGAVVGDRIGRRHSRVEEGAHQLDVDLGEGAIVRRLVEAHLARAQCGHARGLGRGRCGGRRYRGGRSERCLDRRAIAGAEFLQRVLRLLAHILVVILLCGLAANAMTASASLDESPSTAFSRAAGSGSFAMVSSFSRFQLSICLLASWSAHFSRSNANAGRVARARRRTQSRRMAFLR